MALPKQLKKSFMRIRNMMIMTTKVTDLPTPHLNNIRMCFWTRDKLKKAYKLGDFETSYIRITDVEESIAYDLSQVQRKRGTCHRCWA